MKSIEKSQKIEKLAYNKYIQHSAVVDEPNDLITFAEKKVAKITKQQQAKLISEIMQADEKDGLYEPVTNNHTLTAVEWLEDLYYPNYIPKEIFEQAKEMEKQQIINAYRNGRSDQQSSRESIFYSRMSEQYYNETFKNK